MKKLRWFIIICFAVFVSISYSQEASVLDKINQASSVDEKSVDQAPSSSSIDEAIALLDLMDEGIALYKDGKYSDSEQVFEYILQQDPYNRKAMEYLQRIATRVSVLSEVEQQSARAQALAKIGQSWKEDPKIFLIEEEDDVVPIITEDDVAINDLIETMKSTRIDICDFVDEEIRIVLSFLANKTREKSGQNVNFYFIGQDTLEEDGSRITIELVEPTVYDALGIICEVNNWKFEVKKEKVILKPFDYVSKDDLILVNYPIIPEVGAEFEMSLNDNSPDDLFGDFSSSDNPVGPINVMYHFGDIIEWPLNSTATYNPNSARLSVKNTPENIKELELLLNDMTQTAIQKRTRQVQIETKFVEYNEGALEELGYDWTLYDSGSIADFSLADSGNFYTRGGTYNSSPAVTGPGGEQLYNTDGNAGVFGAQVISSTAGPGGQQGQSLFGAGLRSNSQGLQAPGVGGGLLALMGGTPATLVLENYNDIPLDLAITAMEQEGTADVLNAPKVTTKSGNEAVIKVVETHRYPLDYDVETGQRTAPVVKPQDWEDKDLGVVLKVEPTVDVENGTIELELNPSITKFMGYDEYKVGVNSYETGGNNQSTFVGDGSDLIAKVPFFKVRSISTQVTISDGSTVVMGGLVDEATDTFRDQVPLLGDIPYFGRFFRSEGSRNFKRNLLITVKATQVDDRGMTRQERELERKSMRIN